MILYLGVVSMSINLFHKIGGITSFKKKIKHHIDLFKYGKFLQIFLMVGFFVGLFFAVNPIHGSGTGYIEVDVGTSDGPYEGSKFIVKDDYGGYREYRSNIDGDIQICVDYDNGRCDLQYQDLGKIFYINQDCDNFSDDNYSCDKSVVKVSIESDELGEPYARYFYIDAQGNPYQEVFYTAVDDEYIFNNNGGDCIEIKSKVKALGLEEGQFEFELRDIYGNIMQTTTNDESGDIRFCGDSNGTYLITQNFNNTSHGYIIDSAIIEVNIHDDGYGNKNIQYHKDDYLGNGEDGLCFDGEDVNYLNWGYQYQAPSSNYNYYSYNNNYVSFDSWSDWDWNNYVVNDGNGLGYWSDYYDFQDWNGYAFYNKKAPVCIEIETLVGSNKPIQSGQFEFSVLYYHGDYSSISTAKNNGSGVITFLELNNGNDGVWLQEYHSCDIDYTGNTQGEHSWLCYDVDDLFGDGGEYPSYNYNFDYQIRQNINASGCSNYSCDTGAVEVDVSLACDNTYHCDASLMYSDTGFFNAIYTATFDANGADSIGADIITGVTITMPSITRLGYLALGWSTDSGATVAEYAVGESVTLTGDVTLYAITRLATATFLPGQTVNTTLKSLATGATVTSYTGDDILIKQIIRTGAISQGFTTGLLSTSDSEVPIIAWYDNGTIYYYAEADVIYLNQNSSNMFHRIKSGTYIDTSGWDTSRVTNMKLMFDGCNSLTGLDIGNWDTSSVSNMQQIFGGCSSLTGLDVSGWDMSSVTNMSYMFHDCNKLTELDVSKWDTSSVTDMNHMFNNCRNLTSLDISKWDTSKVTDMGSMFRQCINLVGLDVSEWDTSSVVNMNLMFYDCRSLTGLDVSEWDTSRVTNMSYMFQYCRSLETIYASTGFVTSGVTLSVNMFNTTPSLVGGYGTKSPSLGVTKSGAVIDSITVSGYFTYDIAVSYRTRSGVELTRQVISVGSSTMAPTITGYHVLGYYANTGFTSIFNFSQELRKYTEVYVDWDGCETGYILKNGLCVAPVTATFLPGQTVIFTIKTLAAGVTIANLNTNDTLIQQIVRIESIPAGVTTGLLSTSDSETPIIAWFDNGILYYYSDADILYLNQNSSYMFSRMKSCTYIDTSGWNTSKVTNMMDMFIECPSLISLDVSNWDTSNVTNMNQMFASCSSLTGLDVTEWNTSKVTNMGSMFSDCRSLIGLDVSNFNTSKVTTMYAMFSNCRSLTGLDVSNFVTSGVTNMGLMFHHCSSLTGLDVSRFNTSKVTDMQWMFFHCSGLVDLDVSNFDTSSVRNMSHMFSNCSSLTGLDVSNFDTSSVTNISNMFAYCRNLVGLDLSNFDTSKVIDMGSMFEGCSRLTSLDVSNWDTSKVINMGSMFAGCSSLTGLDVSKFDTSSVIDMSSMFSSCSSLTGLDVSNWDTSKVTNMGSMFAGCRSLAGLDVSNFDTSSVTKMSNMFYGCRSLTELDVSKFDTSSVTGMVYMFGGCSSLNTIYASTGFITSGVIDSANMFSNTPKLIGGHGTKFPSLGTTKSGAVLDSESASGYLTYDIAVSYRTSTGVELARQIIDVGDTTVAPSIIRTGYVVSGWYTDTGLTTLFDFSQSLRKYTELYVMWKCDAGYMLSGDGVTCIPLTYTVKHFIKNPGELSYTLSGTEVFTGIAGEYVTMSGFSRVYPSCIVYSRGSLTGDTSGPGVVVPGANIAGDGTTVLNLYYDRNTYTVELTSDLFTNIVEGAGTYECGQEVQIKAYSIEGYHFDEWEGEVD